MNQATSSSDVSRPPDALVKDWSDFIEWAKDSGYDQSYFNRWDSKSLALQELYLAEKSIESAHATHTQ